ncbi:MAG: two-component system sensor histidine kinase HydH [Planctomycetota bacterium]|jgi:two-component system sensor histidine kinase HydH
MLEEHDYSELEQAQVEFANISRNLLSSYSALAERAEVVELELSRTNAELEVKVLELDRVTRDLEAVLSALPTGVVVRDAHGIILRANPAAQRILGVEASELIGQADHPLLCGSESNGASREVARKDGVRLVIASRYSEVASKLDGDNEAERAISGSVEILDDRTEIAQLTERLHTRDKVQSLGTLASGIAHEIRNPLNAVQGFASLLEREFEADSKAAHWASLIVEGAHEANSIITSLLCLGRPESLVSEAIDPEDLLSQAVRAALPVGPDGHSDDSKWKITATTTAPHFEGDRIKLRQAVRNLIANAIDIQPDGGEVEVVLLQEGQHIVICVRDAGPGVPDDIRGKVTDPFFTTRAEGTGLGLALACTIAQVHGGRVEVSPEASRLGGAEFFIRFPFTPVI